MKKIFCISFITLILSPSIASACGMFLSSEESNVKPNNIEALIDYNQNSKEEKLLVEINYEVNEGSAEEFGWIMPFPSKPTIEESDSKFLDEARNSTIRKESTYDRLFSKLDDLSSKSSKNISSMDEGNFIGGLPDEKFGISFLEETKIGALDISTIQAETAQDIINWSNENGFNLEVQKEESLKKYIDKDWFFVLMKLNDSDEKIEPLLFTFDTDVITYPFELMKYDKDGEINPFREIPVTLYVSSNEFLEPSLPMTYSYGGKLPSEWSFSDSTHITNWKHNFSSDSITDDLFFNSNEDLKSFTKDPTSFIQWLKIIFTSLVAAPIIFISYLPFFSFTILFVSSLSILFKKEKTIKNTWKLLLFTFWYLNVIAFFFVFLL